MGRDFEDAIEVGLVERSDLPHDISLVLGSTNGTMVYRLVNDLIANSFGDQVAFSPAVAEALTALKDFNRSNIYFNSKIKTEAPKIRRLYRILFEAFLEDFRLGPELEASKKLLLPLPDDYLATASPEEKTRDFIAGMTDEYFLRQASDLVMPKWHIDSFA